MPISMINLKFSKTNLVHLFFLTVIVFYLLAVNSAYRLYSIKGASKLVYLNISHELNPKILFGIDIFRETTLEWEKILKIRGWSFVRFINSDKDIKYIVFASDEKEYVFDTFKDGRPDVTSYYSKDNINYDKSGFIANIQEDMIKNGKYRIGIYVISNAEKGIIWTGKVFNKNKNKVYLQ